MDLLSIRTDDGVRSAIVIKTGPTYAHVIWADDRSPGVRVNKVPKAWLRYATPLRVQGQALSTGQGQAPVPQDG